MCLTLCIYLLQPSDRVVRCRRRSRSKLNNKERHDISRDIGRLDRQSSLDSTVEQDKSPLQNGSSPSRQNGKSPSRQNSGVSVKFSLLRRGRDI